MSQNYPGFMENCRSLYQMSHTVHLIENCALSGAGAVYPHLL